jgi:TolB protein
MYHKIYCILSYITEIITPITYLDSSSNTKIMACIKPFVFLFALCLHPSVWAQNNIGLFDRATDIGNCKKQGMSEYSEDDQTYHLSGSGTNMWFGSDEFHYLWTTIQGDFILRAEVAFEGDGVDAHRKVGWIVRNNLDANSKHVNASVHGDGLTSLQYRGEVGADTQEVPSSDSAPDVIQLERRGDTYIMSTAAFGKEFTSVELDGISMDNEVYVGIYVCSHNPDVLESAVYRNVRIIRPAASDFRPYRDYLGSNLELMDVESGLRKVIYRSAHSIQAPNWTTDGKQLIYNSKGNLYRYTLDSHHISPINTGFAVNNNNDHVLSFDGTLLGISHHDRETDGASAIYYLPVSGDSVPKRVTKAGVGASYLHGWSPDNKTMIFTGNRDDAYNIFAVDVVSGKEEKLTDEPTLDDGSEYSPDGRYIYFNSTRAGDMDIWRMEADGKNPVRLTSDDYNDWFPHVSPDMKWVLFISFPKDIDPSDHPFYKHCLLRIMPYEGGTPRVIGYIYGGQGSINVPSWSPDSRKIAFVTNTGM